MRHLRSKFFSHVHGSHFGFSLVFVLSMIFYLFTDLKKAVSAPFQNIPTSSGRSWKNIGWGFLDHNTSFTIYKVNKYVYQMRVRFFFLRPPNRSVSKILPNIAMNVFTPDNMMERYLVSFYFKLIWFYCAQLIFKKYINQF